MKQTTNFTFIFFCLSLLLTVCSPKLSYSSATNEQACDDKGGYWYGNECWKTFDDDGIAISEIDQAVAREMNIINNSKLTLNGEELPIRVFWAEEEGRFVAFITVFGEADHPMSIFQPVVGRKLTDKPFAAEASLVQGNLMALFSAGTADAALNNPIAQGDLTITAYNIDDLDIGFSGTLINTTSGGDDYEISYRSNDYLTGVGSSIVIVKDDEIHINGDLGTRTYQQLKNAIIQHPNAKTVVLGRIDGSVNDAINMHTGRILHEAGLTTKVLADSDIASGGVDLFCSGVERIVEKGAKIGIHSWCCIGDLTGEKIPSNHPAHQYQVDYFTMCMGPVDGPKFYFHTLASATFDDIHYMSDEDIVKWKVATQFVE